MSENELASKVLEFYQEIQDTSISSTMDSDRENFSGLKEAFQECFPEIDIFRKSVYFSSSFDYSYDDMRTACINMIVSFK